MVKLCSNQRVWPSGKAVASQATIHGFESRHPLWNQHNSVFDHTEQLRTTTRQVAGTEIVKTAKNAPQGVFWLETTTLT